MQGGGSLLLPRAYPIKVRDARHHPRSYEQAAMTRRPSPLAAPLSGETIES
jgi:hypothetical protein